jgi:predicted permease
MYNAVTPRYFQTLQIRLQRGRGFTDADDEKAPKVAIINQTMAKRLWPNEDAIGKRFSVKTSTGSILDEVVGVAQDGNYKNIIENPAESFFYVPLSQQYMEFRTFHVRTSVPPETLIPQIEAQVHELAPEVVLTQVQTMSQALDGLNGFFFFRFGAQVSGTMGLLGLILAIVGVYSVVSYAAAQRTHEIGIRMALGAAPGDILTMVLRQSLRVVLIGVATGFAAAFAVTRVIADLLVGISPSDPVTFVTVVTLLSGVALLACWIPARRATQVSPLVALRYE